MAPKSLALAALLVLAAAARQVPRCAGLGAASPNNSVLVSGVVPCATGNSINAVTAPPFPNAGLQLVCGGKVVASTTADGSGAFLFSVRNASMDVVTNVVADQCKVVVVTPLGACDKSLVSATGTLTAPLKLLSIDTGSGGGLDLGGIGSLVGGIVGVVVQIVSGIIGAVLNLGTQSFSLI